MLDLLGVVMFLGKYIPSECVFGTKEYLVEQIHERYRLDEFSTGTTEDTIKEEARKVHEKWQIWYKKMLP